MFLHTNVITIHYKTERIGFGFCPQVLLFFSYQNKIFIYLKSQFCLLEQTLNFAGFHYGTKTKEVVVLWDSLIMLVVINFPISPFLREKFSKH